MITLFQRDICRLKSDRRIIQIQHRNDIIHGRQPGNGIIQIHRIGKCKTGILAANRNFTIAHRIFTGPTGNNATECVCPAVLEHNVGDRRRNIGKIIKRRKKRVIIPGWLKPVTGIRFKIDHKLTVFIGGC